MALFTNSATLSYNGTVATSNLVQGEVVGVLEITKTAVRASYLPGDRLTYAVTLTNTGSLPLSDLSVTDDLGAYEAEGMTLTPLTYEDGAVLLYVNGVLTAPPSVVPGPPLVFSGIRIPAGGSAVLIYEAVANRFAPPTSGGSIVNTAAAEGSETGTPTAASETVTAGERAILSISKSLTPAVVSENGCLTYAFRILNAGNAAADESGDATLTDVFTPVLKNLSVTFNGEAWNEGSDYSYDESTGVFTTVPGRITVPAASFSRDPVDGSFLTSPGESELTVAGTV